MERSRAAGPSKRKELRLGGQRTNSLGDRLKQVTIGK